MRTVLDPVEVPGRRPARVLVVDDSLAVRGLLARWIGAEPGFEVVGVAANGLGAIRALAGLKPDIVLLDLEMPEMDGFEALPHLLAGCPGAAVVVVSTLTARSADIALRCLARGAVDYVSKPEGFGDGAAGFRRDLLRKLNGLASALVDRVRPTPAREPVPRAFHVPVPEAGAAPKAIVMGASTGGPDAVMRVLANLRRVRSAPPILIVQHMPPVFTAVFADHIRQATGLEAREATDGESVRSGRVYVAPGGRHMRLRRAFDETLIALDDGPAVQFCRPAADILFRDAATIFGAATLGIVLTGIGHDGTDGARAIVERGGSVIVQDEGTSTIWGMPGSVAKAGFAREILPLDAIPGRIEALLRGARL